MITHESNDSVSSFEDIEGMKAAQSMTSNYADLAKSYGAEIVGVDGFNQAIELINSKRADVTLNDNLSFLDFKNISLMLQSKSQMNPKMLLKAA